MASTSTSSTVPAPVRSWRTAFLTLRDETLTTPLQTPIPDLLRNIIFSNSTTLISAAPSLSPHEVACDVLFLVELVGKVDHVRENMGSMFSDTCHLIQDINYRVPLDISVPSWSLIVESFGRIIDVLVHSGGSKGVGSRNAAGIRPMIDCLESLRRLIGAYHRKSSLPENSTLVKFLCHVIMCLHAELYSSSHFNGNQKHSIASEKKMPRHSSLWEVQTLALVMLGESFSRIGSSFPLDIWQSVIEVLRREMDVLASKNMLIENNVMSKFYASLLQCLHLVLADRKCSLSDHVPGFVAALRIFLTYGLASRKAQTIGPVFGLRDKEVTSTSSKVNIDEGLKVDRKPYRPPHLRKKDSSEFQRNKNFDSKSLPDYESSIVDFPSSDSDHSDSDSFMRDIDSRNSKVRLAAVICIQDLCQADPKSFLTQWTMLLPSFDVLEARKFDSSLMICVLADPHVKVRIAAASTLAVMLDGPSSVFLQVAEYKDAYKYGSFTSLSTSLGQILMQLHKGIMYLIMHETHSGLLASLFNVLMHLILSTPYARMPEDLMPTVITTLQTRIEEGFLPTKDQTGLLVAAITCLTSALSTSNLLPCVEEMLMEEISKGFKKTEKNTGVLFVLLQRSEPSASLAITFEALQALRAVSHHYPNIMLGCWKQVFSTVFNCLEFTSAESLTIPHGGHSGNSVIGEKVITAAIKVLDECLRAVSGFRGTEDLLDDKLLDTAFTSDYVRAKKISSAPSDGRKSLEDFRDDLHTNDSGIEQWHEAIDKYLPLTLGHTSAMVRSASITCFAGITSSVFFSLPQLKQDFIISSIINAAMQDVPSVRLAACRAIGVVMCFPKISQSAEILEKFIRSVEINTNDSLVSVRVTASWALANICDSLKHCFDNVHPRNYLESDIHSGLLALLIDCSLRLTNEGDKVKSNAVRALGNLSRLVPCTSGIKEHTGSSLGSCTLGGSSAMQPNQRLLNSCHSSSFQGLKLLDRIVQAFLSSVTTGNVKVQWNVCHALSNLFRNETLRLEDQDWAPSVFSILLLLLRDSSNYKIRIQAAAALAVPTSAFDYGRSFSDVVQGLQHVLENLGSDQISAPSSFKYRVALEKQLTSTMLHVLMLVSSVENQSLGEFLVKKALFFEEWLKLLCKSMETSSQNVDENFCTEKQKKEIISKAMQSLIQVYQSRNHLSNAGKFEILYKTIS